MEIVKISEFEIEVIKPIPTVEAVKNVYERGFIENQIKSIQKSKDEFNALRDAELEEFNQIMNKY